MSAEAFDRYSSFLLRVQEISDILWEVSEQPLSLVDVLLQLKVVADFLDEIVGLITFSFRAQLRFSNCYIVLQDFLYVLETIVDRPTIPVMLMPEIQTLFDTVFNEVLEISNGMNELVRSPVADVEAFMMQFVHEPFFPTETSIQSVANFYPVQQELMRILEDLEAEEVTDSDTEGNIPEEDATREFIEARTLLYKYKDVPRSGDENAADSCVICLSDLHRDDDARRLPCLHVFHAGCIYNWLETNMTCPICRTHIDEIPDDIPPETKDGSSIDESDN